MSDVDHQRPDPNNAVHNRGQGDAQFSLNRAMLQWKASVSDYELQATITGTAEAEYRRLKAKFIVKVKFTDSKCPISMAEYMADADDEVSTAMMERMLEDARLDIIKKKIQWYDNEIDRLRTLVVSERKERELDTFQQPG